MEFKKTITRAKKIIEIFGGKIGIVSVYSEDYSRDDLILLKNEMIENGLKGERLLRVRKQETKKECDNYEVG